MMSQNRNTESAISAIARSINPERLAVNARISEAMEKPAATALINMDKASEAANWPK